MKTYSSKALIDGSKIGLEPGGSYIAVPDKFAQDTLVVQYGNTAMVIKNWRKEAVMFRRFRDKYWTAGSNRSQYYTLGYFKFRPEVS